MKNKHNTVIYLAGSLANQRIIDVGNRLRELGYEVFNSWFSPGPEADIRWKAYEEGSGRTYREALRGYAAQNIFKFDRYHLDRADICVLLMPSGKSAWLELGYVIGKGKPGFIFLDDNPVEKWDVMACFATDLCETFDELKESLEEYAH